MKTKFLLIIPIVAVVIASIVLIGNTTEQDEIIDSFEDCIAAGNPAMESYPRQCRTPDGQHFVEEINDNPQEELDESTQAITKQEPPRIIPEETTYSCSGRAGCFTDKVTRIVDGDTIHTATLKIRLSLTNTPESYEVGFSEATDFTTLLCPVDSEIIVDQDDLQKVDKYGRVLAKVLCGDKILNSELLYNGHADILTQYCSTSEFSEETWAKKYGCGPYASEDPQKPYNCDPSYPDFCIPTSPPDLDCKDIVQKRFTVIGSDPHGFDGDGDGIGCES